MLISDLSILEKEFISSTVIKGESEWSNIRRILSKMTQSLREKIDELALAQCQDTGKPIRFCYSELERCFFQIENANTFLEGWHPTPTPKHVRERGFSVQQYCYYAPVGRVLAITTFSSPYSSFFQKFLPSLIAKNQFYFKPSPRVRACSMLLYATVHACMGELSDLLHCIVIPDSMANTLLMYDFDAVLFTGKSETAKMIKQEIGRRKGIFETGSNALAYVDKSAHLVGLPQRLTDEAFSQSGMRCIGLKNLFVHSAVAEAFIKELAMLAKAVPYGDPLNRQTIVGPVVDSEALESLRQNIEQLRANGYSTLCGGEIEGENILQPTVLLAGKGANPALKEAYGPLLCVYSVDDCADIPESCLQRSSLNTSLYATDKRVIDCFISRCRRTTATVCINYGPALRMDGLPFGGVADENEGKESLPGLVDFLSQEQLVLVADGKENN